MATDTFFFMWGGMPEEKIFNVSRSMKTGSIDDLTFDCCLATRMCLRMWLNLQVFEMVDNLGLSTECLAEKWPVTMTVGRIERANFTPVNLIHFDF